MAIDRGVTVTGVVGRRGVRADSDRFGEPTTIDGSTRLDDLSGWHRYLWAAASALDLDEGVDLVVQGDLPSDGGLSSSSALTVALLSVMARLDGRTLTADELAALAVETERSTGVAGGAMDQTVIVHARAGHVARIGFEPITIEHVALPDDLAVVVAHSGTIADKGGSTKRQYNERVVGCRSAAMLIATRLGLDLPDSLVLRAVADHPEVHSMVEGLPEFFVPQSISDERIQDIVMAGSDLGPAEPIAVRVCARHVLDEAVRVDEMVAAFNASDLHSIGELFDLSHASLVQFGASTPGLDRVVEGMRTAGAAGARLTGAGFGGFAVAVCDIDTAQRVIAAGADAGSGTAFRIKPSDGLS
jgi:galactokinase